MMPNKPADSSASRADSPFRYAMKLLPLIVLAFSATGTAADFFEVDIGNTTPNHLVPEDHPQDRYDERISDHLFVTSGNIARYVQRPSFGAEYSLAIQSIKSDGGSTIYSMTASFASESLWYSMKEDKEVAVTRSDRTISQDLAISIQRVWALALLETRYPEKVFPILDGTSHHFSTFVRGLGKIHGKTRSPFGGTPKKLISIAEELTNFTSDSAVAEAEILEQLSVLESELTKE